MVVNPTVPAKTVPEFIGYGRHEGGIIACPTFHNVPLN
jgi:hypothetical protein